MKDSQIFHIFSLVSQINFIKSHFNDTIYTIHSSYVFIQILLDCIFLMVSVPLSSSFDILFEHCTNPNHCYFYRSYANILFCNIFILKQIFEHWTNPRTKVSETFQNGGGVKGQTHFNRNISLFYISFYKKKARFSGIKFCQVYPNVCLIK